LASSPGFPSIFWRTSSQTCSNGSGRVRHSRSAFCSLGGLLLARYFLAVFTSMPALAAASSCVFSIFDNLLNLLTCVLVTISGAPEGAIFDGR